VIAIPGKRRTPIDWKTYNKQLVDRGRKLAEGMSAMKDHVISFWLDELEEMNCGKVGAPYEYPDSQIVFFSILKSAFGSLSYRNLEGFSRMFFEKSPDYSRINRRIRKLPLHAIRKINREAIVAKTKGRRLDVAFDATGVQINGRYVWIDEKNGRKRKRKCRKMHIAIDTETRQILGIRILGKNSNEGSNKNTKGLMKDVLGNIDDASGIDKGYFDGSYDNEANFDMLEDIGVDAVIKIRETTRKRAESMAKALKTRRRVEFFSSKRNRVDL